MKVYFVLEGVENCKELLECVIFYCFYDVILGLCYFLLSIIFRYIFLNLFMIS